MCVCVCVCGDSAVSVVVVEGQQTFLHLGFLRMLRSLTIGGMREESGEDAIFGTQRYLEY